jgi:hypothetical protein
VTVRGSPSTVRVMVASGTVLRYPKPTTGNKGRCPLDHAQERPDVTR